MAGDDDGDGVSRHRVAHVSDRIRFPQSLGYPFVAPHLPVRNPLGDLQGRSLEWRDLREVDGDGEEGALAGEILLQLLPRLRDDPFDSPRLRPGRRCARASPQEHPGDSSGRGRQVQAGKGESRLLCLKPKIELFHDVSRKLGRGSR